MPPRLWERVLASSSGSAGKRVCHVWPCADSRPTRSRPSSFSRTFTRWHRISPPESKPQVIPPSGWKNLQPKRPANGRRELPHHRMKSKKKLIIVLFMLAVLLTIWLVGNPPGRFGWCCYGYSTYAACPRPVSDFQVRADGNTRKVTKTHQLSFEQIEWLLQPKPEV